MSTISYTETFDLTESFAIPELGMTPAQDERLRIALSEHENSAAIQDAIEERVTEQLRQHGVDTDTGEWLGEWSAAAIVESVLDSHGA